ncbi:GpE family phage tail protein [Salmonella enterica]|uniref:GpE family phage tail protein n=1 Tax=Edwardsiella ictaluri TaxID=67780 RepID=UPI001D29CC90|nr:GpE family phage tail protein [Salmonella enterica]EHX7373006.1 GpE family phage tail protein [Salmonella enterica]EHZ5395155.1 GpE family phage tail protein [Salmonella enterica]EHZ5483486.1 GpE family phage tail protein [Salmonella enterica]EHZ8645817.1 GpE family phage tail protein [Salmonella enterica]
MMEFEADLYLIFTGWDAKTTESMSLPELMRWHSIALDRHERAKEQANAGRS